MPRRRLDLRPILLGCLALCGCTAEAEAPLDAAAGAGLDEEAEWFTRAAAAWRVVRGARTCSR